MTGGTALARRSNEGWDFLGWGRKQMPSECAASRSLCKGSVTPDGQRGGARLSTRPALEQFQGDSYILDAERDIKMRRPSIRVWMEDGKSKSVSCRAMLSGKEGGSPTSSVYVRSYVPIMMETHFRALKLQGKKSRQCRARHNSCMMERGWERLWRASSWRFDWPRQAMPGHPRARSCSTPALQYCWFPRGAAAGGAAPRFISI